MKSLIRNFFLVTLCIFFCSCGTREYLGFEEKKIKLKGKRVSILKSLSDTEIKKKNTSNIELEDLVVLENWKQSYNSPSHLSKNHSSISSLSKIKKVTKGAGEKSDSKILSQPVSIEDNIYFLDAKSNVISYNLLNRRVNWKKNIAVKNDNNHNIGGGLAIQQNRLIINSPYGEIIALNIKDGQKLWTKNIDFPLRSAPTLLDNKILSLSNNNNLLVLNIEDGDLLWEHRGLFNNTTLMGTPKVAVDGNIVIVPYSNGDFYGINLLNGKEVWKNSFIDLEQQETTNSFMDIDAFPIVKKDLAIITSANGKLISINKRTGNRLWTRDIYSIQTPAINGNSIFIINNNKEILCLDLTNGETRWDLQIDEELSKGYTNIWFSPVLINNQLIIVGGDKKLLIVDPFVGEIKKILRLSGLPSSSPFIVKENVYLFLRNGDLVTVE